MSTVAANGKSRAERKEAVVQSARLVMSTLDERKIPYGDFAIWDCDDGQGVRAKFPECPECGERNTAAVLVLASGAISATCMVRDCGLDWEMLKGFPVPRRPPPANWNTFAAQRAVCTVDLPPGLKHLLMVLALRTDKRTGETFPSQELLARDMGKDPRSVKRDLRDLRDRGLIAVRKSGRHNIYAIDVALLTAGRITTKS